MGHSTRLQVLIVSDVTSWVLFNDAVQLGVGQVLNFSLRVSSLFLCYHGLLKGQVAPRDLVIRCSGGTG